MAKKAVDKAQELLTEGKNFNFNNFAKFEDNFPLSFSVPYASWKIKVQTFLQTTFGKSSPLYTNFEKGEAVRVLGNYEHEFDQQFSLFIGTLQAAVDELEYKPELEEETTTEAAPLLNNKVFIVHGHDTPMKQQLEIFLKELGIDSVVLHRQADEGLTIIEKFEKHSDVGYAFILLTPDDIGYPIAEDSKQDAERAKEKRARQNVIFEFGYFVGKLSRKRVCCLYKKGVTVPTDIAGMVYKEVATDIESAGVSIMKDLKAVGYIINI